jgi:hypothetical protein
MKTPAWKTNLKNGNTPVPCISDKSLTWNRTEALPGRLSTGRRNAYHSSLKI